MSEKQEDFLNHLAKKLGRPRKSGIKPPNWGVNPYIHLYHGKTQEELINQFIENLNLLDTEVDRINKEDISKALAKVIVKFSVRSVVMWDDDHLHELQVAQHLQDNGVDLTLWGKRSEAELREIAAQVDLGITFADMGLAETGTVVFENGSKRGRVVSVLPPAFLCILREKEIVPRLTQATELIHSKVDEGLPACINFITGPSRTGDIEMDLALGVHGPGKVHIILLKE